jgi:hypothetical protein
MAVVSPSMLSAIRSSTSNEGVERESRLASLAPLSAMPRVLRHTAPMVVLRPHFQGTGCSFVARDLGRVPVELDDSRGWIANSDC